MAIAQNLRNYLISHGIKQTFIAEKCGWSKQKVNCIVTGKQKMTAEDFSSICKAIGAPYELFLGSVADQDSA